MTTAAEHDTITEAIALVGLEAKQLPHPYNITELEYADHHITMAADDGTYTIRLLDQNRAECGKMRLDGWLANPSNIASGIVQILEHLDA